MSCGVSVLDGEGEGDEMEGEEVGVVGAGEKQL
jgi:hypothetical protein